MNKEQTKELNRKLSNELHAKTILPIITADSNLATITEIACQYLQDKGQSHTCNLVRRWGIDARNALDNSIQNTENVIAELRKIEL